MAHTDITHAHVRVRDVLGRPVRKATVDLEDQGTHYVAKVTASGYHPERVVLDFNLTGEVTLLMDPEQCLCPEPASAGKALLEAAMHSSYVAGRDVYSYLERDLDGGRIQTIHVQPDRGYYYIDAAILEDLEHTEAWHEAPASLHHPPAWARGKWPEAIVSYKDKLPRLGTQLTFWAPSSERTALEVDVDVNTGIRHAWDALVRHPLSGQPDPRIVGQLLAYYRGLKLPFRMVPR